jgi:hypothetical protein
MKTEPLFSLVGFLKHEGCALARFHDLPITHAAITPPSTGRMLPVVQRDSSDAK